MNIQEWENEIAKAFENQNKVYTNELRQLMLSSPSPATEDEAKYRVVEVVNAMQRYFWKKAEAGQTFGSVDRVKKKFGKSLEENYGLSSGPFLQVAQTYWTYQIEVEDIFPEFRRKWIGEALKAVEIKVRELFSPTAGPVTIPAKMRRSAQKEFLEDFAPGLDIERFLRESPILKADANSGCLGMMALLSLVPTGLATYKLLS